MSWLRQHCVVFLLLGGCSLYSVAPAVEEVSTKKQWLALIDAPTGGKTSPDTGLFTRSNSISVVACTRERWIKDAFMSVAEVLQDQYQFLYSTNRKLCRQVSLEDDRIGLVTSVHQSTTDGVRDMRSLDLKARAAEMQNVRPSATLPPRLARRILHEFVSTVALPLVGFLTIDSMLSSYDSTRPLVSLFCPFSSVSDDIEPYDLDGRVTRQNMFARSPQASWCRAPLVAAMNLVLSAGSIQSNLTAVVAEIEEHRQMELQEFGYDDLDGVGVGARISSGFKYRLQPTDQLPSAGVLVQFIKNVIEAEQQGPNGTGVVVYGSEGSNESRTMRPYLKSAPVPRSSRKGAVKVVVGETFHNVVLSDDKDVLIALYAPWCEECPRMLSELKATAAALRKSKAKSIEVAQFDFTVNDAPKNYQVNGVPTIYWAPIEDKQNPMRYDGDLTARGFQSFVCRKRSEVDRALPDGLDCSAASPKQHDGEL